MATAAPPPPPPGQRPSYARRSTASSPPTAASSARTAGRPSSTGRNVLLIERIRELEQQVEELRQGVPFVDENTVRSFLTQIDLAYTEDLENQTKQLKEQVAAITQEKEQLASLLDQARVKAEESKAQFEQQLQAARRDAEKAARHKQKAGVTEELRKAKARVNKLSDALQRQREETEQVERQRDTADRKRVDAVQRGRSLEKELHKLKTKQTAELEHMADVKRLWKGVVDALKSENQALLNDKAALEKSNQALQARVPELEARVGSLQQQLALATAARPPPFSAPMSLPQASHHASYNVAPSAVQGLPSPGAPPQAPLLTPRPYDEAPHPYAAAPQPQHRARAQPPQPLQPVRDRQRPHPGPLSLPVSHTDTSTTSTGPGANASAVVRSRSGSAVGPVEVPPSSDEVQHATNSDILAAGIPPLREDSFAETMGDTLPGGFSMTALGLPPDLMATIPAPAYPDTPGEGQGAVAPGTNNMSSTDDLQSEIDDLSARMAQETHRAMQRMQQLQMAAQAGGGR